MNDKPAPIASGLKPLKWADEPLDRLTTGHVDVTIRYDDERHIQAGDGLDLQTKDGEPFGVGYVPRTTTASIHAVPSILERNGYDYPHRTAPEVCDALEGYYGHPFTSSHTVKIIEVDPKLFWGLWGEGHD